MHQFFVEDERIEADKIRIQGADVNHISHVLRMKPGEKIRISGEGGKTYFCHIAGITKDEVTAAIDSVDVQETEFPHKVYLFQGLPKGDKMELVIQKAVELGVYEIIPVEMKNCVVRLDEKKAANKVKRWQTIAQSAAKQSKRTMIPMVSSPVSWKEALQKAKTLDVTLVPYENERGMSATRETVRRIPKDASIGIMIGPEGGYAAEEIEAVTGGNMHRISLGKRILRTETAGLVALSMLIYELE